MAQPQQTPRITPVLLAGGSGDRLWPLSMPERPKPFLSLFGVDTLLQSAGRRVSDPERFERPLVLVAEQHRFLAGEQLRAAGVAATLVLEPEARGTAMACAVGALLAAESRPEGLILILPTDHIIGDGDGFEAALGSALPTAQAGRIVALGVPPQRAETAHGYIRRGERLAGGAFTTEAFVEKPPLETAEAFVASGGYFWNTGIVLCRAEALLAEFGAWAPDVLAAARQAVDGAIRDADFIRPDRSQFIRAPCLSIDHAVMERTALGAAVEAEFDWADVGTWAALWDVCEPDLNGNVTAGPVRALEASGNYLRSEGPPLAVVGVRDLVVVATAHGVLVAHRTAAQKVRALAQGARVEGES